MDRYPAPAPARDRGFASGIKTAVVVVVLGTLAAVADHAFYVTPHAVAPAAAAAGPIAGAPVAGDRLPPDLHPTAADTSEPAPSF
ncbi:MAG: hypothetical protein U1F10_07165 [Burkholderiales bacterium]